MHFRVSPCDICPPGSAGPLLVGRVEGTRFEGRGSRGPSGACAQAAPLWFGRNCLVARVRWCAPIPSLIPGPRRPRVKSSRRERVAASPPLGRHRATGPVGDGSGAAAGAGRGSPLPQRDSGCWSAPLGPWPGPGGPRPGRALGGIRPGGVRPGEAGLCPAQPSRRRRGCLGGRPSQPRSDAALPFRRCCRSRT